MVGKGQGTPKVDLLDQKVAFLNLTPTKDRFDLFYG